MLLSVRVADCRVKGREGVAPAQDSELQRKDGREYARSQHDAKQECSSNPEEASVAMKEIRMLPGNVVF
jgi:hypothetical protein